jgi:hypothetical protein
MEREKYILSGDVVCVCVCGYMGLGTVPVGQVPYESTARHVPGDSNLTRA